MGPESGPMMMMMMMMMISRRHELSPEEATNYFGPE
jgi:hypothetical protein